MDPEEILLLTDTSVSWQRGKLVATFEFPTETKTRLSKTFVFGGAVAVQFQTISKCTAARNYYVDLDVTLNVVTFCDKLMFKKLILSYNIDFIYENRISNNSIQYNVNNITISNKKAVHTICEEKDREVEEINRKFDITIWLDMENTVVSMFDSLYDDTDFVDFKLCSEGGSVDIHKNILAAASSVFKRMLLSDWKEGKEGKLTIPGISTAALEDFKAYLYLGKVPDKHLDQLLLFAARYMMSVFELQCIDKILSLLTAENTLDWCMFAMNEKMTELHLAILQHIKTGGIDIGDIYLKATEAHPTDRDEE